MDKLKTKLGPLTYIEWHDCASYNGSEWKPHEEFDDLGLIVCFSAGFLRKETEEAVTLVAHVNEDQGFGEICIPKKTIITRREIRISKGRKRTKSKTSSDAKPASSASERQPPTG